MRQGISSNNYEDMSCSWECPRFIRFMGWICGRTVSMIDVCRSQLLAANVRIEFFARAF